RCRPSRGQSVPPPRQTRSSGSCTTPRAWPRLPANARGASSSDCGCSETIDHIQQWSAVEGAPQVVADGLEQALISLDGRAAAMRCEDHVLDLAQGRMGGERLDLEDVEAGAGKVSRLQGINQ